jgi:predicted MFS family arabinose efflux permease
MWVQTKAIFLNSILYYPKMSYMFIVIILDGLVSGFISTYISKLIYVDIRTNINVGFLLMTEGVGCIFGAMLSAFLSDKFEVLNVGRAGLGALMLTACLTLVNYIVEPQTMFFPMVVGVCWGFVINYFTSWESVSCAKINEGCL